MHKIFHFDVTIFKLFLYSTTSLLFLFNAMSKDSSLSTTKSSFSVCVGETRLRTMHELWLILHPVLSLNMYVCREFTARVFPIYPEQGQWKMTLSSCTSGGRNCKQKTSPAFFIGVWCQFRECSVTAWQRMCKHLLFLLEYCQHQANQNSDLLLNCPKCLFCLHFQTHTKPTRRLQRLLHKSFGKRWVFPQCSDWCLLWDQASEALLHLPGLRIWDWCRAEWMPAAKLLTKFQQIYNQSNDATWT